MVVVTSCRFGAGGVFFVSKGGCVGGCWMCVDGRPCSSGVKWTDVGECYDKGLGRASVRVSW